MRQTESKGMPMTFPVKFTRKQVDMLEKQYPELIGTYDTPADEIRWRAAQRSVLQYIKCYVDKGGMPDGLPE